MSTKTQYERFALGPKVILPVEEGLRALTLEPCHIIKLKVMAIAMARINLLMRRDKNKNMPEMKTGDLAKRYTKHGAYCLEPML